VPEECKMDLGYTLNPEFHNKGYMTEASARVISFAFNTMKLKTIEAYTHKDNKGSIRILLRNNFRLTDREMEDRAIFVLTNEK